MDFNSQPHKEADCNAGIIRCGYFISTHSLTRRLTNRTIIPLEESLHFNSQPHKEADNGIRAYDVDICAFQLTASQGGWRSDPRKMERHCNISTHSLTRRLTDLILLANGQSDISTHSLTRRLTVCLISNSSQQENFNSQPHKEADGLLPFICRLDSISTHSLTRRLTKGASCQGSFEAFQLTASQGGWPRPVTL